MIHQKAHFSNPLLLLQTLSPEVTHLISKHMIGPSSSCLYLPQRKMLSQTEIKKKKLLTQLVIHRVQLKIKRAGLQQSLKLSFYQDTIKTSF